jgi:hypothetical protein
MKHSELKQIIKEEIYKVLEVIDPRQSALDDFGTRIKKGLGIEDREPGRSQNRFRVEKLPNYDMLPEKRTDVNFADNNKISIFLPSISGNGTTGIYSKQDVDVYVEEFKKAFGESPKFVVTGEKVEIGNDKFAQKQDLFRKAMGTFGTQGD